MPNIKVYNPIEKPAIIEKTNIINFLYEHLEEYGDPREDISRAINYALKEYSSFGGFILVAKENDLIIGSVVVNKTGMKGYIPENILVYIATHKDFRGKGIGKLLMEQTLKLSNGDFALHVEADNPAKHLYKKVGFSNRYLEMRYRNKSFAG